MAATRWGIASAGRIAFDFTNALSLLPAADHKVVAVGARALSSAEKFAKQFNIPRFYGSYKELAADPDIDIVYVATIHPTHFEVCKLMIEAGKNVLCEKPMMMNVKDAKTIIALAKEKNVFFLEGIWSRFFPVYDKLREELAKKTIGDVKYVNAHFGHDLSKSARTKQKELGGGATLDLGVYVVQFAQLVLGEYPEKIVASGILTDTDVDEAAFVTLHFSGGRVAQLQCHAGLTLSNEAEVVGTKGRIVIPHLWCPDRITVEGETHVFPLPTAASKPMNYFRGEGFTYEAEAVRQCLLKGEKEAANYPHEHSLWNMSIVTEILNQIGVTYD